MFFIKELMDEVEITRLPEGGNQVRMVIYLTPPHESSRPQESGSDTPSK
jgi:anti-sigma regulatory factor (Ser/Thr protein kinase)